MSAKKSKQGAKPPAAPVAASPSAAIGATPAAAGAAEPVPAAAASWLDSADPRKRRWGQVILIGVWIYVGALWLLALDQTFHWGIFGPKGPPLP